MPHTPDTEDAVSRNENGQSAPAGRPVPAIPLSDADLGPRGEPSIGNLVKDATASMSTLVRAEVALAKAELVGEAKKAGAGTGALIVAGVTALYASFFFFFFLAELLDEWLPRWASFLIVFALLVVITVGVAIVGYVFFRKVRGPKKTIESVKEIPSVLPTSGSATHTEASVPDVDHPRIPPAREG
ncbi:phage holin family protein [Gordonia desulfuricans]|uniref:Phage holin family protein n=1 Tax=Gordonia desulfuricans TaxID=89051 RepID=A0A7K3LQ12_9ACTN|nr:phage holin family protein [Gordonia desulfuricans]NDK89617.1 phage holin family protein [Gordonia desulfuricans]